MLGYRTINVLGHRKINVFGHREINVVVFEISIVCDNLKIVDLYSAIGNNYIWTKRI